MENMNEEQSASLSRRGFVGGVGLLAAGAVAGSLLGCAPSAKDASAEDGDKDGAAPVEETPQADRELDCDIVVVGAGGSGLAACVEAAEAGKKVICIESQSQTGGNQTSVEGCFAANSSMQKADGVEVDTGSIIRMELEAGQYRIESQGYIDLVHRSGENIDWQIDHGVKFLRVDGDHGDLPPMFHRYEGSAGTDSYAIPMTAAAEAAGAEILLNTHGDSIARGEDGSIQGVYATEKDGSILKINAKAVIVATGGFLDNEELMREMGFDPEYTHAIGLPGHDGVGHQMAIACGAADNIAAASVIGDVSIYGLPDYFSGGTFNGLDGGFVYSFPYTLWLDEHGERFLNEDLAMVNMMIAQVPMQARKWAFAFADNAIMEKYLTEAEGMEGVYWDRAMSPRDELQGGIDDGVIFKADTLEELAKAAGMDIAVLEATVESYNKSVEDGSDHDFGKAPEFLQKIEEGPYYACTLSSVPNVTIGSIKTNRNFNAVDKYNEPIDGLYVVGVEGAMFWANVYTINIPGGCCANNVNSGRVAARHAIENCL